MIAHPRFEPERAGPGAGAGAVVRPAWGVSPWLQPFAYAYLAWCWWRVGVADAVGGESVPSMAWARSLAPALLVAGKFGGFLIETLFYRLLWRGRGRSLPFWRFFCVVAFASLTDVLAFHAGSLVRDRSPGLGPWLAPVVGLHLASGFVLDWSPALRAAFGTAGLLTAIRLALTAYAQQRAFAIRWRSALTWTGLVWLVTRLAILFTVDLMRGMSPLPAR